MAKVIKVDDRFQFLCPACNRMHELNDTWSFNGDFQNPTFSPSIKVTGTHFITEEESVRVMRGEKVSPRKLVCHSFIRNGKIEFCGDCTHEHAGKTLELECIE